MDLIEFTDKVEGILDRDIIGREVEKALEVWDIQQFVTFRYAPTYEESAIKLAANIKARLYYL